MAEAIFGKTVFDMHFEFLAWPMSYSITLSLTLAGFLTHTVACHWGAIKTLWFHFWCAFNLLVSIYIQLDKHAGFYF